MHQKGVNIFTDLEREILSKRMPGRNNFSETMSKEKILIFKIKLMINQKYHFDITPHIVKQLGEQLVSDEITALLELIKNSFDADATYVSIEINTTGQYTKEKLFYPNHRGFIVVEDDGFGMSENTIMKSWLLISYSQKGN